MHLPPPHVVTPEVSASLRLKNELVGRPAGKKRDYRFKIPSDTRSERDRSLGYLTLSTFGRVQVAFVRPLIDQERVLAYLAHPQRQDLARTQPQKHRQLEDDAFPWVEDR